MSARLARKLLRLSAGPFDNGCGEPATGDVAGCGFLGWGSAGSLFKHSAFNTISWDGIKEALEFFEMPSYIIRIIRAYLIDRWVGQGWRGAAAHRARGFAGFGFGTISYDAVPRCLMSTCVAALDTN